MTKFTNRSEPLFVAEAALRHAAERYQQWTVASNRTPKDLNDARAELRRAAREYARQASEIDGANP